MDRIDRIGIGDFARASGLTPKALRLYDELGLLPPAEVDPSSGYRRYAPGQLATARLVARLRLIGMPLARIRGVVALGHADAALEVAAYWRQVEADTVGRRALVADLLRDLEQEEQMAAPMNDHRHGSPRVALRTAQGARPSQQDAVLVALPVLGVADGFGPAGSGADGLSARALEAAAAWLAHADPATPATALAEAVAAAGRAVEAAAGGPDSGSTVSLMWLTGGRAWVGHLGDARVHRVRDGRVERLTHDHTLVAELVDGGRLTEDEARVHPHRALLNRALAPGLDVEPDLASYDVRPGDRFVLTTDGVHALLGPADLERLVAGGSAGADPDAVASAVVAAVEAAGAPDNLSVVVVDLPMDEPADA